MGKSGFTLMEILIILVILGVLSGIGFYYYNTSVEKAMDVVDLSNIRILNEATGRFSLLGSLGGDLCSQALTDEERLQLLVDEGLLLSVPRPQRPDMGFSCDVYENLWQLVGGPRSLSFSQRGGLDSTTGEEMNTQWAQSNLVRTGFIGVIPGSHYRLTGFEEEANFPRIYWYDKDHQFLAVEGSAMGAAPAKARYVRFRLTLKNPNQGFPSNVSLEIDQ